MAENPYRKALGIPRHAHLLDWIEERRQKRGCSSLEDYFGSIKEDIEEALTLIDGIERFSPSSISQLLQVSKDVNFPIPVLIHQDDKVAFVNHAVEELAGSSLAKGILGKSIFSFIPKSDHHKMIERIGHLARTGVSADPVTQVFLLPDGTEIEVMLYGFLTTYQAKPAIQIMFWQLGEDQVLLNQKQAQLRITECLNEALIQLISDEEEDVVFPKLLEIVCTGFQADRVTVFRNVSTDDNNIFANHLYEWTESKQLHEVNNPKYQFFDYHKEGFERWLKIFSAGECLAHPIMEMPEHEQVVLQEAGISSILAAPILIDQELWGFISVVDLNHPREWDSNELSVLKSLGLAVSGYIQRRASTKRARNAEKAIQKAQEIGGVSSLSFHVETGEWYLSDTFIQTFGVHEASPHAFAHEILKHLSEEDHMNLYKAWNHALQSSSSSRMSGQFAYRREEDQVLHVSYLIESRPQERTVHAVFRDITESTIANEHVYESRRKLERTQKIGKVGFWEYDLQKRQAWLSDILYDLIGISPQTDVGNEQFLQELFQQEDIEELIYRAQRSLSQLHPLDLVQKLRLKNGSVMYFEIYGELIMDQGVPVRISGTCKDISEQEAAREKGESVEVSLGAILESTKDLIISLDKDFKITAFNSSFRVLIQKWINKDIAIGTDIIEVLTIKQDEDRAISQIEKLHQTMSGQSVSERLVFGGKNEENITYDLTLNPIFTESGEVVGISVFGRDISTQLQKEREIRALNASLERRVASRTRALEKINHELESFAYSVSHDLRTPLRHLSGYSTLLMARGGDLLDEESKEYIEFIGSSSRKMNDLIEDLLEYSRLGRKAIHPQLIDITSTVHGIVHYFMDLEQLDETEFDIRINHLIYADTILTETVLTNLISNAVKYRKEGAPAHISVLSEKDETGVRIIVQDHGIGFDMKYIDQVFGLFKRLHSDDEYEGSGIGLANVARIMHRHSGSIEARSEPGQGSTFICFFPDKP